MKKEIIIRLSKCFEESAHVEQDVEYWMARDLQVLFEYDRWDNFINVIEKAKTACFNSKLLINNHFREVAKMVNLGSGTIREIPDFMLSRYACYLIAQNGDSRKESIAFAQSYFALQTRKQEILEKRIEELGRLEARKNLSKPKKNYHRHFMNMGLMTKALHAFEARGIRLFLVDILP